ncbi:hypothetical protein V8C34DRAFT_297829 [Trichoderma compactum]
MSVEAKPFGERVIPLSAKDQWRPIHNLRTLVFIVVRDILDDELMRTSLDKLIRNHIPILGARIKPSGADGLLQYHLTTPFPDNHQLFSWSTSNIDSTLEEANLVPEHNPQRGITLLQDVSVMERHWIPSDWPVRRDQDKPDTPLLLVHLAYYKDATIISLNLPHCVSDQMGFGSLITSWIDVMKGKEPQPFVELPEGGLDGAKDITFKELHKKYEYRLKTKRERAEVLIGLIPELVARPKETRCTIFLPVGIVTGLRDKWRKELKAKYGSDAANITNGDVLVGIVAKFANMHRKTPKKQVVTGPVNLRGYHPLLPKNARYLHNALIFAVSRTAISRSEPPTSEIAYGQRLAVLDTLKPDKVERGLAVTRELLRRNTPMHICEPWEFSYGPTNWCNAWHGIEFSAASAHKTGETAESKDSDDAKTMDGAGSAPIILGQSSERNHPNRLGAFIMSKAEGGYWVDFAAANKGMAAIRALLERDPNLETI